MNTRFVIALMTLFFMACGTEASDVDDITTTPSARSASIDLADLGEIEEGIEPARLAAPTAAPTVKVTLSGTTMKATVTGGTAPYKYSWRYFMTTKTRVCDDSGCYWEYECGYYSSVVSTSNTCPYTSGKYYEVTVTDAKGQKGYGYYPTKKEPC